jgi:hypothetical protein
VAKGYWITKKKIWYFSCKVLLWNVYHGWKIQGYYNVVLLYSNVCVVEVVVW